MTIDNDVLAWYIGRILEVIGLAIVLLLYLIFVMLPVMAYDYLFMTYDIGRFGGRFGTGH